MKAIIHRGSREIGGSCVELIASNSRIILDFGMPLVDESGDPFDSRLATKNKSVEELKVSKLLPNIKGLYQGEHKEIEAVLISHSHQDHYGLLKYIHPDIPVYMSQGAKKLIDVMNIFIDANFNTTNFNILKSHTTCSIGDFQITPYLVDHSAFDAFSYKIESEGKRVFYSGDFRGHGRKSKLLDAIVNNPPKNIDCLLMEGSMLGRTDQKYEDEEAVSNGIEAILNEISKVAFLFCSGQNIDRIVSAYKACRRTNTIFVIDLYTAYILTQLKEISSRLPQFDWVNVRVKFMRFHANALAEAGLRKLLYIYNNRKIDLDEINNTENKYLILARNNSIFPVLVKNINDIKGTPLIHSMWEGYITEGLREFCKERGLVVKQVHTSGHATIDDLKRFSQALKPKTLVPIHTFNPECYSELFDNVMMVEDGQQFEI